MADSEFFKKAQKSFDKSHNAPQITKERSEEIRVLVEDKIFEAAEQILGTKKQYSDQIVEFLKTHPLISANALEKELNLPQSTIGQALNGSREIPLNHMWSITCKLIQYGFKPNGYSWTIDEDTGTIFGRIWKKNVKTKEKKGKGGGTHFVYVIEEYRTLASDIKDLI